jgi:hypothetical protein
MAALHALCDHCKRPDHQIILINLLTLSALKKNVSNAEVVTAIQVEVQLQDFSSSNETHKHNSKLIIEAFIITKTVKCEVLTW